MTCRECSGSGSVWEHVTNAMVRAELRRHVTGATAQDGADLTALTQRITAGIAAGTERKRVFAETVMVPEISRRRAAPAEAPAGMMTDAGFSGDPARSRDPW
jgi:hypothetical protein